MDDFGKAIQTLRKRKGITQSDLAASLNVSGQAVSKWENNLSQPDLETVKKIMRIFEVSWDEFTALCEGNDGELKKINDEKAKAEIAAAAATATQAANDALNAANEAANVVSKAKEVRENTQLYGVCAYCGKAVYDENKLAVKTPKIVCLDCADNWKRKKISESESEKVSFKKQLIIPSVIVTVLAVIFTIGAFAAGNGIISLCVLPFALLVYLPIPQIFWGTGPIPEIFDATCGKSIRWPGIIFELSIGGVLWAIAVKIVLWLLGLFIGLVFGIFGYCLCMIISPFSFVFAKKARKKEIEEDGQFTVRKMIYDLDKKYK